MPLRLILAFLTLAPLALSAPGERVKGKTDETRRSTPVLAAVGFAIPQPEPPRKRSIRIIYSDEEVEIVDEPVDKSD